MVCSAEESVCSKISALEIIVITFWDWRAMIYIHYCPAGQTGTAHYKKVITQLIRAYILRKWLKYQGGKWKFHENNARPHVLKVILTFFAQKKIELMSHLAYCLDLVPSDFFLFPDLKKELKGRRFSSWKEIMETVHAILKRQSKNGFEIMFKK